MRERRRATMDEGEPGYQLWPALDVEEHQRR
jgi:hypothetical protein